jgi:hypothetical protein
MNFNQFAINYVGVCKGVMKPENVARGFEKGLTMMWQRFCSGLPVESFSVPKDEG